MQCYRKILQAVIIAAVLVSCGKPEKVTAGNHTEDIYAELGSISEYFDAETLLNSHAGDEMRSVLQPVYRYYAEIPNAELTSGAPAGEQEYAFYPRLKCLKDGSFIMFYMGSQYGSRIWCVRSRDFINWSDPVMLFEPERIAVTEASGNSVQDWRRFANMDAAVLPDGKIVAVCSYRASGHYGYGLDCGLMCITSTDNGCTWSSPEKIYEGPNWEPYVLSLPDGRLQCFFTDAFPQTRNSGTSVIVSADGGKTWSGKTVACRQYKYDYHTLSDSLSMYNGQRIYTDQMPCFRVLNDGKTIFGFLEARLETPRPEDCGTDTYSSHYMMSLVWNDGSVWKGPAGGEDLPERRMTNVCKGSGGYVETFPSGEVVISAAIGGLFKMKIGNSSATEWQGRTMDDSWLQGLPKSGFWGCMERYGTNALLVSMRSSEGLQNGMLYLNNRVDLRMPDFDGAGGINWKNVSDALYISSKETGMGAMFRFACSADTLFIRVDREDLTSGKKNMLDLCFSYGSGERLEIVFDNNSPVQIPEGVRTDVRKARSADNVKGFVFELAVPRYLLGNPDAGDRLDFYADMQENGLSNTFTFADKTDPETWQLLEIVE